MWGRSTDIRQWTSGGPRPNAGRPTGVPNKATAEVRELAREHGPAAIAELGGLVTEADTHSAPIAAPPDPGHFAGAFLRSAT